MRTTWFSNTDSLPIRDLRGCDLQCVPGNRDDIGVYVVLRTEVVVPTFLAKSTGGRFKGGRRNL